MGDRDQSAPLLRKHINMSIIKAMPNWIGFVGQVFGYTLFGAALPDLILNHSSVRDEYNHIRSNVWHELTHASQLRRMTSDRGLLWASEYWSENVYVQASNSNAYGSKGGRSWQIIALSEGWANYRERIVLAERFNTNRKLTENPFPPFPRNYAFMFRDLANLGISQGELERALSTWTIAGYRDNLIARHPNLITQITDIVNRYL